MYRNLSILKMKMVIKVLLDVLKPQFFYSYFNWFVDIGRVNGVSHLYDDSFTILSYVIWQSNENIRSSGRGLLSISLTEVGW